MEDFCQKYCKICLENNHHCVQTQSTPNSTDRSQRKHAKSSLGCLQKSHFRQACSKQDIDLLQCLEHGRALLEPRPSLPAQHVHTTQPIPWVPPSISVPEGHSIDPQLDYVTCLALASLQQRAVFNAHSAWAFGSSSTQIIVVQGIDLLMSNSVWFYSWQQRKFTFTADSSFQPEGFQSTLRTIIQNK